MKKAKYFIFSLICLFSCGIVFAKNEVVIKSMIPVYDENSGVIVTEENGVHSVIFNDKDQSVKYNVVIENTTNKDIPIDNIELPKSPEDFFKYELTGLNNGDVLKADSTKEVVISLETVKTEGWGRNFNDELIATINFDNPVTNPNTSTKDLIVILLMAFITGTIIVVGRKNKVARYIVLILTLGSTATIISAEESIEITIKTNVSFESQNTVLATPCESVYDDMFDGFIEVCDSFWNYKKKIKEIYIENDFREIKDYTYKFDVSEEANERALAYLVANKEDSTYYDLYLQSDGLMYLPSDSSKFFADMYYLESINNIEGLDTSNVTNMMAMFASTGKDNPNFTLDLSSFDTSNVTNMGGMFRSTGNQNFNLDLSSFDTSNVTNMSYMFSETGKGSANFTLDLSGFDTGKVTDMTRMFDSTGDGSTNFNLDLSGFGTGKVTDMTNMFIGIGSYSTNFTLDLSNFDTSNVTNMAETFLGAGSGSINFTLDLSDFDTSKVTDMNKMFMIAGDESTNFTLDLSGLDTGKVIDMSGMFWGTGTGSTNFTLDVSHFDTSNVTNMSHMFSETGYNSTVFTLDVSHFNTSKVTDMSNMFSETGYNSKSFTLDVSNFDTSNVTNMASMFSDAGYNSEIFTLDVSNFDTSKVTNMLAMFSGTGYNSKSFTLDVSNFDTSNVTNMASMFSNTGYNSEIFTLDVSHFDTSKVTNMYRMFKNAGWRNPNFTLDVSNFDTSKVTKMNEMFYKTGYASTKLNTSITIKNPKTSYYTNMFYNAATQTGSQITVNYTLETSSIVDKMIATKSSNSNVVKGVQVS